MCTAECDSDRAHTWGGAASRDGQAQIGAGASACHVVVEVDRHVGGAVAAGHRGARRHGHHGRRGHDDLGGAARQRAAAAGSGGRKRARHRKRVRAGGVAGVSWRSARGGGKVAGGRAGCMLAQQHTAAGGVSRGGWPGGCSAHMQPRRCMALTLRHVAGEQASQRGRGRGPRGGSAGQAGNKLGAEGLDAEARPDRVVSSTRGQAAGRLRQHRHGAGAVDGAAGARSVAVVVGRQGDRHAAGSDRATRVGAHNSHVDWTHGAGGAGLRGCSRHSRAAAAEHAGV